MSTLVNEARSPLVSVITVCLNSAGTLQRCISSVEQQTYKNIEYLVIDGGSSDGTQAIIEANSDVVDRWISEPDDGISDAFNKGIALASGEYYLILNSDDWLRPKGIEQLLSASGQAHVICGGADIHESTGELIFSRYSRHEKILDKSSINHGTCLIRRSVHDVVGNYRLDRSVAMDHAFFLAVLRHFGESAFASTEVSVVNFSMGGISDIQAITGFNEVRKNLIEAGVPSPVAAYRFCSLCCKHHIVLFFRRFGLWKRR